MNILLKHIGSIVQDGGQTFVGGGDDPEEPSGATRHTNVLIPFSPTQYYENNIDILSPPDMLNNGIEAETPYLAHFTYLRGQDRTAKIFRRFKKEWQVVIKQVRWYRASVFGAMTAPTKIHLWRRDNDQWMLMGSYDGSVVDAYVEYTLPAGLQTTTDVLVLEGFSQHEGNGHMGSGYCWPSELQVIGDWTEVAAPQFTRMKPKLKDLFAADSFWWNLNQSNDGGSSNVQNMDRINRHIQMGITNLRPYITRRHIEDPQGVDHWDVSTHGWRTDLYYQTTSDFGIRGHLLVMGLPPHLYTTWEGSPYISPPYNGFSHPAQYFTPVTYANRDNREIPASYDDSAKFAYRAGIHYGASGLGTVQSFELLNEPDATWLGKYGHMDGAIMAAYMSAIYDGHKGILGAGRGIKNAAPEILVCIPGLAISKTDLIRGFIDWCIYNRGYLPDGSIDLPFDVINYHEYSTDGATQFSRTTTAFPPELSRAVSTMREYIDISNRYCNGKEVWVTEWGYDTHPQSAFAPPAVGTHSIEEVAGCWAMRTILHQIASGISGSFWFQTFANNMASPVQFDTMRLLEHDGLHYPRTPVGDYYMQLAAYGEYEYDQTLATTPYVMRFKNPVTSKTMYVIWAVETPFATSALKWVLNEGYVTTLTTGFTEVTGSYNLSLPFASSVNIRKFVTGGNQMSLETKTVTGGIVSVSYGMFPTIVTVDTAEPTPNLPPVVSAGPDQTISFGATLSLSGSAIDPDGTLQYTLWSKVSGPTEKYRSSTPQTFSTGTKTWTDVPSGNYFTAGLGPLRFYCLFDDYLIGTITSKTSNGNGTDTVVANITSFHQVDAVVGQTYFIWDLGRDSVITSSASPSTTVTNLVPGTYVFKLIAEDDDFATGRDTTTITVNP